ncbi:RNA-binding domain-containing protein [Mycena floridula]|nr:RNA-binding domain-containing protein [Mycena floridula]
MSRLLIKNLPAYVTPVRLREHFEQRGGTITDSKVAFSQNGASRRFGFVGYKTEDQAREALEWFDKTYIDSARISVEVVQGAKDAPAPRPNKRPRLGPSPHDDSEPKKKEQPETKPPKKSKKDAQMDEFMEVMQTKKGPSWANEQQPAGPEQPVMDVNKPEGDNNGEGMSDLDWMKRHMTKGYEQSDDEDHDQEEPEPEPEPIEKPADKDPTSTTILQTARLFVRNLAFSCTQAELEELFSPFGTISQVHIPLDKNTKESKGVAYVTFAQASDALSAYESLDRKSFQGRLLHILAAVDRKEQYPVEESEGRRRTVKDEKMAKRKSAASKEFNWSMLYMNSDAVASSIADRMGVSKAAILNPESSDNAAVKLALAETHIIQETKTFFETNGVVLDSFSSRQRSDTVILVKNIPYGTSESQIREMFEPHGTVTRVLVPPAGTIAVVEFEQADEASKGFKAVAYRRLGNSIVYLEKGPLGMFTDAPPPTKQESNQSSAVVRIPEQNGVGTEDEASLAAGTTLFVKNLAFSTTSERLVQIFGNLPSFSFARVQMKPDPKRPDAKLSMGYGFIGFSDVEGARKAMKSMQGFALDGHALHIKFAGRGIDEEDKAKAGVGSKSRTTKMIVKNVPFEATKKDIRELFGAHGHLKSVRMPKKFDSRTRGFAFLEFVSRQEAENAFATLRHTHLLGRHLVLEWAEEAEQDLDALRRKAGVGLGDGKDMPGRKRKLDMGPKEDVDVDGLE